MTTVYSSAWESPVITTGAIYARFDSTWDQSELLRDKDIGVQRLLRRNASCSPCTLYYSGSSGPQAGELPGAQPITVYTFGPTRPGYVFVQTIQQLLDRTQSNGVIYSSQASGTQFGSVPSSTPSTTDALGAVDNATTGNSDFGGFLRA